MSKDFEISKLLDLSREQKYATTVAAFEVIDMLEQIEVPRKMANRKPAVKAMNALFEQTVQWDYIGDEAREALAAELENSRRANLDAVFGNASAGDTAALAGSADAIGSEAFNTMAEGDASEMEGFQSGDAQHEDSFGDVTDTDDSDDDDDDSDDSYNDDDDDDDRDFDFGDGSSD